jgi:hypothetical protein
MRNWIAFAAFIVVAAFAAGPAEAERVSIAGNHPASEVQAECEAGGGVYTFDDLGGGLTAYGCTRDCQKTGNNNIDADHCTISCTSSVGDNCYGWIPERLAQPQGVTADIRAVLLAPEVAPLAR